MNYGYMIIYKKPNGKLIYRGISNYTAYRVGDKNSYGWEVMDIKRLYKGKTYSIDEYNDLLSRKFKVNDIIRTFKNIDFKKIIEIIMLLLIIKMYL